MLSRSNELYCWSYNWNLQAVLVAAYCRRLERLAGLLSHYVSHLQHVQAALGLVHNQQQQQQHEQAEEPGCTMVASAGLANCLQQVGEELAEAAAALIRSISAITNSTNSALLALALKRTFRDVNSALSTT